MEKLQNCLRKEGYSRTCLVRDYARPARLEGEDKEAYFTRKSFHWLKESDVNLFVFICGVSEESASIELTYLARSAPEKIEDSVVLFEGRCYAEFPTLLRGVVKFPGRRIPWAKFASDSELCLYALAKC